MICNRHPTKVTRAYADESLDKPEVKWLVCIVIDCWRLNLSSTYGLTKLVAATVSLIC